MSRSSKHIVGYAALAVVLIATGSMAYGAVAGSGGGTHSNTRTVPVEVGSVSQTVSATGNLQPASQQNVNFQTSGTITEIDAAVGDQVTAGQVLAKLDPSDAASNLVAATLSLNAANTKLWQASAGTSTTGQGATNGSASTGAGNGNGSGNGSGNGGASSAVTQAQLNADRTSLSDAQAAAKVNAQGYQLAVDQAQAQLTADQQNMNQAAIAKDQAAVANAKQAQAAGTQRDQQTIHNAQSKVDLDQAQLDAATAAAAQPVAPTTTVDPGAVDSAQASVVQAQSSVDAAQKALDATTLTAPTDGLVTSVTKAVGDQVTAGSSGSGSNTSSSSANNGSSTGSNNNPASAGGANNASNGNNNSSSSSSSAAFTLITPNSFQVKVGFPESDAIKVQVGQQAETTLDALPGSSFPGTVQSIDQTATVTSNVVTYNAIISVTGTPTTAKSGMTANVTVTTMSKDNVLEVPTAAVQTQGGSSSVNKLVNGQSVQTDVTTGLQGDSNTEITSGLTEGDQVVIDTGTLATAARSGAGGSGNSTGGGGFGGGGGFTGGGGGFGGGGGGFTGGGGGFGGRGN